MKTLPKFHHAAKLLLSFLLLGASALAQTTATVTVLGGEQSSGGVWDSGDVTIEVSGTNSGSLSRTVPYGQFSTPASVAAGLAALISRECYGVASAKADGATITFHLRYATTAPISITAGTPHWDGTHFSNASFGFSAQQAVTPTQVTLAGNAGELVAPNTQIGLTASIAQTGATGAIEFYDHGALLGTSVISGSQANYTTPPLAAGAHELYAKYTGDGSYAGSTSNTVYATAADHSGPAVGTSMYWYNLTDSSNNSGYAANSNVVAYNDAVMGQWSFGYDSLNRLSSGNAQTGPVPSQVGSYFCWSYDSFGNRLSQVVANQGFSVSNGSSCQSNGVLSQTWTNYDGNNRITGTNAPNYSAAPVYDNGGNITNDGRNLYLYDGEGRVCAVQAPSPVAGLPMVMQQYIYDAEGRRVGKGTISSWSCNTDTNGFVQTTAYVDGPDGGQMTEMSVAVNGQMTWVHTNVTVGGKLIATYENDNGGASPETGKLHFALNDWLGTKRVQTSYDGSFDNSWVSLPFGEVPPAPPGGSYAAPDATEQHFTGKERDAESGLDYFGARYYASNMGRFMSPDWAAQAEPVPYAKLGNPQTLNLYSYVQNNPLSQVDSDGHETLKPGDWGPPPPPRPCGQGCFVMSHPIAAFQIGWVRQGHGVTNISTNAVRFSAGLGLTENASHEGSQVNAMRHATWQATITSKFGSGIATDAGNAHETNPNVDLSVRTFSGKGAMGAADQTADLLNNQIGRSIGDANQGASMNQLAGAVLDYYHSNGLYTATQGANGTVTVSQTRLSDAQYNAAKDQLKKMDENGFKH